jgi:hypothetical protein
MLWHSIGKKKQFSSKHCLKWALKKQFIDSLSIPLSNANPFKQYKGINEEQGDK